MAYLFEPDDFPDIVQKALGLPRDRMFAVIIESLQQRFPDYITPQPRWFMNNAGGAMGVVSFLFASLSEYIMLFGTPLGTEGHCGRYPAEIYDFVLDGEVWCFEEGAFEREVYKPGDVFYHNGRGRPRGYRIKDHAWMLEYGRGRIPFMLPFGLADAIFSIGSLRSTVDTIRSYGSCVQRYLFNRLTGKLGKIERQAPDISREFSEQ